MKQQEEKTILILGNNNESIDNTSHLSQDDFTIVLKDVCEKHTIITSIKSLTYRVEIFKDGALEDAVEVVCDALKMDTEGENLFKEGYTKVHQKYKDKFCQKVKNIRTEDEVSSLVEPKYHFGEENKKYEYIHAAWKRVGETYQKLKAYIRARGYNHRIVLVAALLTIVFLFIVVGRVLICNEKVIAFFVKEIDKVSYYEQTESFCHKLETGCLKLSKMNLEQDTLLSPKDCRTWCQEKIISVDKCALFLPYFPQEEEKTLHNILKKDAISKMHNSVKREEVLKDAYIFTPEKEMVLYPQKYLELVISNNTESLLKVKLKNIVLNENEHEEIVQFRLGVTALSIAPGDKKRFKVFLEQTYYEQFEKGEYTGKLSFSVFLPKREEEVEKIFSFRVE